MSSTKQTEQKSSTKQSDANFQEAVSHMNIAVTAPQPVLLHSAPIAASINTFGLYYSVVAAASQGGRWGHTHGE